jgi:hypothetical protein
VDQGNAVPGQCLRPSADYSRTMLQHSTPAWRPSPVLETVELANQISRRPFPSREYSARRSVEPHEPKAPKRHPVGAWTLETAVDS